MAPPSEEPGTIPRAVTDGELRLVAARRSIVGHLQDIWRFRELLVQLTTKELIVRYKKSTLGFLWSTLNPLVMLGVYSVAFAILGLAFASFPIWLITGLLVWNLFSSSLVQGTQSITSNAYLVGKVRFPREILPLASVGASLVHFALQGVMVAAVLAVARHDVDWAYLWLLPLAVVALGSVICALVIVLSSLNVYARDTGHLLELAMTAMFWLTPIGYAYMLVAQRVGARGLPEWLPMLNPITTTVITFQRAIYGTASIPASGGGVQRLLPDESPFWYARSLLVLLAIGLVMIVGALRWFDRVEGDFAEVM
jgi:ABC-2 type transport system permease protein